MYVNVWKCERKNETLEETQRNNQIIMEAAIKLFTEKGYEYTNMQDIAHEANITRGPLYYRYKTKADLYQEVVRVLVNRELQEYKRIFSQDKHIIDMIREDLYYCTSSFRLNQLVLTESDVDVLKDSNKILKDARQEIYKIKEDCVTRAIHKGELKKNTDAVHVVNLMFIFAEGLNHSSQKYEFILCTNSTDKIIDDILYLIKNRYCKTHDIRVK